MVTTYGLILCVWIWAPLSPPIHRITKPNYSNKAAEARRVVQKTVNPQICTHTDHEQVTGVGILLIILNFGMFGLVFSPHFFIMILIRD